jgi:hydrogenase maturation factor
MGLADLAEVLSVKRDTAVVRDPLGVREVSLLFLAETPRPGDRVVVQFGHAIAVVPVAEPLEPVAPAPGRAATRTR